MMIILKNPLSLSLSLVSRFIFSPPYKPIPSINPIYDFRDFCVLFRF